MAPHVNWVKLLRITVNNMLPFIIKLIEYEIALQHLQYVASNDSGPYVA